MISRFTAHRLFFERAGYVDAVFAKLARSIIDGPLSKLPNAKCHTIKSATADPQTGSSSSRGKEQMWLICLYFDNVWNVDHAKEVLECVVKEHGFMPNSVKADLYTIIGLDSNVSCRRALNWHLSDCVKIASQQATKYFISTSRDLQ